jgi:plasmid maintenance system antidote protein VapI
MTKNQRLGEVIKFLIYSEQIKSQVDFADKIGLLPGYVSAIKIGDKNLSDKTIMKIVNAFPCINEGYLQGEDIEMVSEQNIVQTKKIPFFDDVATIGGKDTLYADVDNSFSATDYVDIGDLFPGATAAIKHYGDSMVEYPSNSMLIVKRIEDLRLIMWGRNYVIETTEFRITKKLQSGKDNETIMAYSTNKETYPDGHLIYEPITIPLETIRSADLVLGCVTEERSDGVWFSAK